MIRNQALSVQAVVTPHGLLATRQEAATDETFLFSLFESVKGPDFARMPVDDRMKTQLLRMQYSAMTQSYRASFPDASFAIITMDGAPIGRLITDVTQDRLHIVLVAFLPDWRHRNLGSALMRQVLTQARTRGLTCEATVALDNIPSRRLWARLDFIERSRDAANVILIRSWS